MNDNRMEDINQAAFIDKAAIQMENDMALKPEENYFEGESARFNKFIIENDRTLLPPDIENNFWAFMDKEMALSNLDNKDIKRGLLWFDIAKINFMMNKPDYKLDFDTVRRIDQARFKAFVKMKRSFGGSDRERAQLTTQIRELRIPEAHRNQGNFISRWFGGNR